VDALNLQEKRKKSANIAFALDMLHIVVGILIVIFAVLAFLNPDENRILFPVIFLLAAVLNFANGYDRYRRGRGRKHLRTGGMILMAVGAGLLLLCIVSTLTIWWG